MEDAQHAVLNILLSARHVRDQLERVCDEYGVTAAQFNVLRILRGGPPQGYSRREISERMIERAPDCTRLIDRLEKQGLVSRKRTQTDRRLSLTQITPAGLALLQRMDEPMLKAQRQIITRLSAREQNSLSQLLEKLR
jgi:DNA-binding MarR family transcriptional regulator